MASGLRKLDALSVNKWEKASSFHSGLWCFNNITSNKQKHLFVETKHHMYLCMVLSIKHKILRENVDFSMISVLFSLCMFKNKLTGR